MRLVMSAIEAVVWTMGKKLPPAANASFMGEAPKDIKNVSLERGFHTNGVHADFTRERAEQLEGPE